MRHERRDRKALASAQRAIPVPRVRPGVHESVQLRHARLRAQRGQNLPLSALRVHDAASHMPTNARQPHAPAKIPVQMRNVRKGLHGRRAAQRAQQRTPGPEAVRVRRVRPQLSLLALFADAPDKKSPRAHRGRRDADAVSDLLQGVRESRHDGETLRQSSRADGTARETPSVRHMREGVCREG